MIAGRDALGRGLFCAFAGGFALVFAFWLEHAQGMAPCALCLWERVPYRLLLGTGIVWALFGFFGRTARPIWALAMLFACGALVLSGLHVGVEQGWWPSPLPECQAPHFRPGLSFAERLAAMPARPAKPCDAANPLFPGSPVSVVSAGFAYALVLCLVLLAAGPGRRRRFFGTRHG
ncbi:disulfide bond formation protein B [Acetobacteraceae bacterium KSS8]|uniref:Disulfide bond formation protein B n=1 Tax=Endosaccharibacter trunci TaxID=2812733 RepID=A0ABT1W9W4_9PROT|nr:disulfide bond formation protein B [Acetobacteraceae bacterium KSS8]